MIWFTSCSCALLEYKLHLLVHFDVLRVCNLNNTILSIDTEDA